MQFFHHLGNAYKQVNPIGGIMFDWDLVHGVEEIKSRIFS